MLLDPPLGAHWEYGQEHVTPVLGNEVIILR